MFNPTEGIVFVYAKLHTIRVLSLSDAKKEAPALYADGWVHTATIDSAKWIENLHNEFDGEDMIHEVNSLRKK